jgi:hypothetical protein
LNRKENIPPSTLESMPMDSTMFYVWEVQISNLLGNNKTKINSNRTKNMTNCAMWFYVERCKAEKTCARRQEKHVPNIAQWEVFSVLPTLVLAPLFLILSLF